MFYPSGHNRSDQMDLSSFFVRVGIKNPEMGGTVINKSAFYDGFKYFNKKYLQNTFEKGALFLVRFFGRTKKWTKCRLEQRVVNLKRTNS
ncbi:MAG TPA: hypothetical protein VK106_04145 [Balneolaceae bacterium]|nr:hypothetical protein [Balneolaceae bacterium]